MVSRSSCRSIPLDIIPAPAGTENADPAASLCDSAILESTSDVLGQSSSTTSEVADRIEGNSNEPSRFLPFRRPQYASDAYLEDWIPETNPRSNRARTYATWKDDRRTMLLMQSISAASFTIVALVLMGASWLRYPPSKGIGTFYHGDCSTTHRLDSYCHVGLNVVASLFLGAGNYTMQVLVAPSRREADNAHRQGSHLDIGIHSVRNVFWIRPSRRRLWGALAIVATVMHLFWNSAVFQSFPIRVYPVAIATSDFLNATDNWVETHPELPLVTTTLKQKARELRRVANAECISSHINPQSVTSGVILVSKTPTADAPLLNGTDIRSSLLYGFESSGLYWEYASWWICTDVKPEGFGHAQECTAKKASALAQDGIVYDSTIDYCLIGPAGNNAVMCEFHYSTTIYIIVVCCMITEAFVILYVAMNIRLHTSSATALAEIEHESGSSLANDYDSLNAHGNRGTNSKKRRLHEATMVTLGDALAEYLKSPDESTGLVPPEISKPRRQSFSHLRVGTWVPKSSYWFHAVSGLTWILTSTLVIVSLTMGVCLYNLGIQTMNWEDLGDSVPEIWQYGLGVNSFEIAGGPVLGPAGSKALPFVGKILFVNSFQVLVSILYLFVNNCLTKQVMVAEMSHFMDHSEKKPLRVSSHVGMQRSTYMLSLPWRYSIPLVASFAAMHFFVSRSTFIVQSKAWTAGPNNQAQRIPDSDVSRVGYSTLGIFISTVLGSTMFIVLLAHSFRTIRNVPAYLPRVMNKTSFISAACQRPDGDRDAQLYSLKFWAVDSDAYAPNRGGGIKKIVFSTDRESKHPTAREPDELYEQPMPIGDWDDWSRMHNAIQRTWRSIRRPFVNSWRIIQLYSARLCEAIQMTRRSARMPPLLAIHVKKAAGKRSS